MIPTHEHGARLARLQETLRAEALDGALLLHATDVYYFTGTRQNAALWIPARGEGVLLVRRSEARARAESAVRDVRPFPRSRELPGVLGGARRVGLTLDIVPVAVRDLYARSLPGVELADVSAALRRQRSVKSPAEVALLREAAGMVCAAVAALPGFLRRGMREIDVAAELEQRLRRAGSEGNPRLRAFNQEFFGGVVTAGPSALEPNYFDGATTGRGLSAAQPVGASTRVIGEGEPILVDFTAVRGGYVVDMTRVAVLGALSPQLERAFAVSLAIQEEVASGLRPGALPSALWQLAAARADEAGLGGCFMGPPGEQARFVGHGVGLELDELPVLAPGFDAPLVERQVIAVEPKFVIPGVGAVGIENTWVVGAGGGERLTTLDDAVLRA